MRRHLAKLTSFSGENVPGCTADADLQIDSVIAGVFPPWPLDVQDGAVFVVSFELVSNSKRTSYRRNAHNVESRLKEERAVALPKSTKREDTYESVSLLID
jgi:hypothetical protein